MNPKEVRWGGLVVRTALVTSLLLIPAPGTESPVSGDSDNGVRQRTSETAGRRISIFDPEQIVYSVRARVGDLLSGAEETVRSWQARIGKEVVLPVEAGKQKLPLDCEAQSAADAARYLGIALPPDYASFEEYFRLIPKSDNPDKGYRGNMKGSQWTDKDSPNYGYGVHAQPVADAFAYLGVPTQVLEGEEDAFKQISEAIVQGKIAMVWIYSPWYNKPFESKYVTSHIDQDGDPYKLVSGEHVMLGRGVSGDGGRVLFNDPYSGKGYWKTEKELREMQWGEFDCMTLIIG